MKHVYFLFVCFFVLMNKGLAQNFCGQAVVTENWLSKHPEHRENYELKLSGTESGNTTINPQPYSLSQPGYTIPVVFHILHTGGPENISDAQVQDQITILNRDFQKKNADTLNVVAGYTNNIANVGIAFQLASIDPNGNCTNGIIRHYTANTLWDANNLNLFDYTWPRDKYLNIYVVKSINIAPAYSFLPSVPVPDSADVVVSQHNLIGSIGTSNVFNSRAITHEVGHWLNLAHIWGVSNLPGVSCGDDGVSDTPITKGFTTCSPPTAAVCNPTIQENYQNYMDYAPCKIMFTNGQANRMITCLTSTTNNRKNLYSASNLLATGITTSVGNCIPLVEVAPVQSKTLCLGQSLTVKAFTSNANTSAYAWYVSDGASLTNTTASSVTVTPFYPGNYTITCVAAGSGGSGTGSVVITAISGQATNPGNYFESFEGPGLPANWLFLDPVESGNSFWSTTNEASSDGLMSAFVNAENAVGGAIEILETPSYDFLNNPGSTYSFKYAYARKSANSKDVLQVQASRDCGGSWKDIVVFNSVQLAQGSGGISSSLFLPSQEQWKTYVLSDHPNFFEYQQDDNVRFRYVFKEDSLGYGNRIYLDEINLDSPVGINAFERDFKIELRPNPAKGHVRLHVEAAIQEPMLVYLTDVTGKQLLNRSVSATQNPADSDLIGLDGYPPGLYFIQVQMGNFSVTKKLVVY